MVHRRKTTAWCHLRIATTLAPPQGQVVVSYEFEDSRECYWALSLRLKHKGA